MRPSVTCRWVAYLLECADGSLYAGATSDVARRLEEHAAGASKYTRSRLPVRLVWRSEFRSWGAALAEERRIKLLSRAEKIDLVTMEGCAPLTVGLQKWQVLP